MSSERGWFGLLEAKAPTLFLVGGALYAVLVANRILGTYTGTSFSLASTFAWAGTVLVPLGLLGLYPALVERRPYLARVAAGVAVILALSSSIVAVGESIEAAGLLSEAPGPLALTPFVAIISMYLGFALFGIATLLADVHPKAVGILMLVNASVYPLFMTILSGLPVYVANGVNLVAFLAIGLTLLTADLPTDGIEPPADTTA